MANKHKKRYPAAPFLKYKAAEIRSTGPVLEGLKLLNLTKLDIGEDLESHM